MVKLGPFAPKNQKFERGRTPCGNCNMHNHQGCRPRLDGSPCSCSCPRATAMRNDPTAVTRLAPKFKPVFQTA